MEDYYLEPGFDPNTLRVVALRKILLEHNVQFGQMTKKKALVELFEEHIQSQANTLRQEKRNVQSSSQGIQFMNGASRLSGVEERQTRRKRRVAESRNDRSVSPPPEAQPKGEALLSPRGGRRKLISKRTTTPAEFPSTEVDFSDDEPVTSGTPRRGSRDADYLTPRTRSRVRTPLPRKRSNLELKVEPVKLPNLGQEKHLSSAGVETGSTDQTVPTAEAPVLKDSPLQPPMSPEKPQVKDVPSEQPPSTPGREERPSKKRKLNRDRTPSPEPEEEDQDEEAVKLHPRYRRESGFFSDDNPFQTNTKESPLTETAESQQKAKKKKKKRLVRRKHTNRAEPDTVDSTTGTTPHSRAKADHRPSVTSPLRHGTSFAPMGTLFDFTHKPQPVVEAPLVTPHRGTGEPKGQVPNPYAMRSPPVFAKTMQPIPLVFSPSPARSRASLAPKEEVEVEIEQKMPSIPTSSPQQTPSRRSATPMVQSSPRHLSQNSPLSSSPRHETPVPTRAHAPRAETPPSLATDVPDVAATIPDPPTVHPVLKRRFRKSSASGASEFTGRHGDAGYYLDNEEGGCLSWLFSITLLMLGVLAGILVWHRQESFRLGYCNEHHPAFPSWSLGHTGNYTWNDWSPALPHNVSELWEVVKPTCVPCPHRAHCSQGQIARCDEGFMVRPHPMANPVFPFPEQCVPDTVKLAKVEQVCEEIQRVLSRRLGQLQCNWRQYNRLLKKQDEVTMVEASGLPEQHLYAQIHALKEPDVSDEEFLEVWNLALRNVKQWDDRIEYVLIETSPQKETLYLVSKVASLPWLCQVKTTSFYLASMYQREILSGLVILTVILFIRARYRRYKREAHHVQELVQASIQRLVQQEHLHIVDPKQHPSNALSVTQLRDVLVTSRYASGPASRNRLWERVRKHVEHNSNVRVRMTQVKGEPHRVWEWIGATQPFIATTSQPNSPSDTRAGMEDELMFVTGKSRQSHI
ncbi:inner nuclear membrane protein enriched at telomere/subtelomere region [Dispira parvispora]|uniref:Inner nuclear membrane protein enriched at telomere/subtelomere region n=1 Tax=Dispira parvispora TaxID=1520584 RepID=A0A9W8AQF9_9FUNG|nr:inner nuclear membrane protein enriched at telomere/subtelomere region [Dispira parvispora]